MPKILVSLTLVGDDVPVKLFTGPNAEARCRVWIATNPPQHPRHATGDLKQAVDVFCSTIDVSDANGYRVTRFDETGVPDKSHHACFSDAWDYGPDERLDCTDFPFDTYGPLFPAARQEE